MPKGHCGSQVRIQQDSQLRTDKRQGPARVDHKQLFKDYHGYDPSQSALGHLKLWCEHSIGIGCHCDAKLFGRLVLGVIYEASHSFFRWKT